MPKYMVKASYTPEGVRGVMKEGASSRRAVVESMINGLGGSLEAFHFAFGDDDVYVTADLPSNSVAAALALAINSTDAVSVKTVVLMTPEEVDEATKLTVGYKPPGA